MDSLAAHSGYGPEFETILQDAYADLEDYQLRLQSQTSVPGSRDLSNYLRDTQSNLDSRLSKMGREAKPKRRADDEGFKEDSNPFDGISPDSSYGQALLSRRLRRKIIYEDSDGIIYDEVWKPPFDYELGTPLYFYDYQDTGIAKTIREIYNIYAQVIDLFKAEGFESSRICAQHESIFDDLATAFRKVSLLYRTLDGAVAIDFWNRTHLPCNMHTIDSYAKIL